MIIVTLKDNFRLQLRIADMTSDISCRILFLASDPANAAHLALDEECREIEQKIRSSDYRSRVEFITKWAIRPDDLLEYLNRYRPHVVHFSGHGTPNSEIALMDQDRKAKFVSEAALTQVFAALRDNIRVVVLNACYSVSQAAAIAQEVECVVGMNSAIGDHAARVFAAAFYRAIGYGRSVEEAFDQGRAALSVEGIPENHKPVLHLRSDTDASKLHLVVVDPNLSNMRNLETKEAWSPAVLYPLQPANYFGGRDALVEELSGWIKDTSAPIRVLALVAPGGTGKTAIAERVLSTLSEATKFGVFVWSFYENPKTEEFLLEAYKYFSRKQIEGPDGLVESLQKSLSGKTPHVLILDGLELVQVSGNDGLPRGQLEDLLLKRLLRWLAGGVGTRSKALITSRYSLPDLQDWLGQSFREEHLPDLTANAAMNVLRSWGVKGTDLELSDAIRPLQDQQTGSVHALSASVLGSYLGKVCQGDVTKAPIFDAKGLAASEPKAAKITRILTKYAEQLSPRERDLLARLALFPRGANEKVIQVIIDAGGTVAGHLSGLSQLQVQQLLHDLCDLGLVFQYPTVEGPTYTSHPFLREFFGALYGIGDPTKVHEVLLAKITPSLIERWRRGPTKAEDLDRYEYLILIMRLAGHIQRAFDLFSSRLGGYRHLGYVAGENARGVRILSGFSPDGTPASMGHGLSELNRVTLLMWWGLFAQNIGDLCIARRAYETSIKMLEKPRPRFALKELRSGILWLMFGPKADVALSTAWRNLAEAELLAGRWSAAESAARKALSHAPGFQVTSRNAYDLRASWGYIAAASLRLGRVAEAVELFGYAVFGHFAWREYGAKDYQYVESNLMLGNQSRAQAYLDHHLKGLKAAESKAAALCATLRGECALPEFVEKARTHLETARIYCRRSDDVEILLRCYQLGARIARLERNYALAVAEAEDGIHLADSCDFTRWSIDCRIELSKAYFSASRYEDAGRCSLEALALSENTEIKDAWGIAEACQLLKDHYAMLGDDDLSRRYLVRGSEARMKLDDRAPIQDRSQFWSGLMGVTRTWTIRRRSRSS
jgi:tetratricopeptide (TPR) repeat protein